MNTKWARVANTNTFQRIPIRSIDGDDQGSGGEMTGTTKPKRFDPYHVLDVSLCVHPNAGVKARRDEKKGPPRQRAVSKAIITDITDEDEGEGDARHRVTGGKGGGTLVRAGRQLEKGGKSALLWLGDPEKTPLTKRGKLVLAAVYVNPEKKAACVTRYKSGVVRWTNAVGLDEDPPSEPYSVMDNAEFKAQWLRLGVKLVVNYDVESADDEASQKSTS